MGLIEFVLLVALVGFIIYLITAFIPMPEPFKIVIYGVAALVLIIALLRVLNIGGLNVAL
jgi:uncharacterized membrane protein